MYCRNVHAILYPTMQRAQHDFLKSAFGRSAVCNKILLHWCITFGLHNFLCQWPLTLVQERLLCTHLSFNVRAARPFVTWMCELGFRCHTLPVILAVPKRDHLVVHTHSVMICCIILIYWDLRSVTSAVSWRAEWRETKDDCPHKRFIDYSAPWWTEL